MHADIARCSEQPVRLQAGPTPQEKQATQEPDFVEPIRHKQEPFDDMLRFAKAVHLRDGKGYMLDPSHVTAGHFPGITSCTIEGLGLRGAMQGRTSLTGAAVASKDERACELLELLARCENLQTLALDGNALAAPVAAALAALLPQLPKLQVCTRDRTG